MDLVSGDDRELFVLLPEFRLAICLTPKVAATSIIDAIGRHYGARIERPYHANSVFRWFTQAQIRRFVPHWRRAMWVRNPFDRLVACYEFHVKATSLQLSKQMRDLGFRAGMPFQAFLERVLRDTEAEPHYALQSLQSERVDFLGRFETMAEDWRRMRDWLGADLPDLAHLNKTEWRRTHRSYYSPEWRERVERTYEPDLRAYGYRF